MRYTGFWIRFSAFLLDFIILLPLMTLYWWASDLSRLIDLYYLFPSLLIGVFFHIYLVTQYGGSPGKLILQLRITKLDGTKVGTKDALLRYLIYLLIPILLSAYPIFHAVGMTDAEFFSMDREARGLLLMTDNPRWDIALNVFVGIWLLCEITVLFANIKRRALHDYIASTVVIHK